MKPAAFWNAYTHHERILATNDIEEIIHEFGFITEVNPFSDIAIKFTIELPKKNIMPLYQKLKNYLTIDAFESEYSDSSEEQDIYLNVTFTAGSGNLRNEIPAVPG